MRLYLKVAKHNILGKKGEQYAIGYLVNNGYCILATNFRYRRAEIDIIAIKGVVLSVFEVKTRSWGHLNPIAETLSKKQRERIVKAADFFIRSRNIEVEVRFDIITILHRNHQFYIEFIEDAYYYF